MYAAYSGSTLIWLKPSLDYFTIEVVSDGTIVMEFSGKTTEMRVNNGDFQTVGNRTYSARAGDIIQFRGTETNYGEQYGTQHGTNRGFRGGTATFNVRGNLMSMLYPNSFEGKGFPSGSTWTFSLFFSGCTGLINASGLTLPSSTVPYCYDNMFRSCTSLQTTPTLSGISLTESCYSAMFYGCTSLSTAPALPVTTLADSCYMSMFAHCTSLTTAPVLPATVMQPYCYDGMFHDCTSLVNAPALPATKLIECCYATMFMGCTALTTAPVLPATGIALQAYYKMFDGCTSLNYIKALATYIVINSTNDWVKDVSPTGTFVKDASMNDWPTGNNGIPTGWSVVNA